MNENQIVVRHESEGGKTPTTGDESQDVSTITKTIKGRGPSKGVKVAKPMFLEYNVYNVPDGQWSHEYGKQVGSCATRININVPLYPKVDEQTKKGFWEETKLMFHITDDSNHSREKYFHSCVAKRFSCFKSKLVRRWITMKEKKPKNQTNKMPWDVYNHITEDDWKTFVKHYFLPESLLRSEKARKSASCNKNPHRTGQKGYNRKRLDWIKDGRLPPDATFPISSSSSVNSSVTSNVNRVRKYRSKEWILAHQVQNKEGKWEIDPNDTEVVEIATKALEYIAEEEKGNLSFEQGEDALTKAIGKKDHRGRVKGTGGMVGIKKAFGPCIRHSRSDHGEASSENYESIRASVKKEFEGELEKRVEKRVAEALQKQLSTLLKTGQLNSISTPILDDFHLNDSARVDLDVSATRTTLDIYLIICITYKVALKPLFMKERTPCRLALEDKVSGNNIVVADGMVQPSDGALPQHFTSMKPGHYKVQVDFVYDGHVDDILSVPTGDGFTNLGGALGSFVQWPIHLVIFEDGEDCTSPPKKKSKSNVSKERDGSSKKKTTVLAAQKKTTDLASKEFSHPKKSNSKPKSNLEVVGSCDRKTQESTTKSKKAGLVHDAIQGLGPSCKYL
ncbi:uncharacterized protein [Spinacia oleracea]|uniref:DUF8039 domain-containing protein n=1 Tax=Spinacia oleracea TaxID=3562 RepID=A0ABM3QZJ9_SPIOL|nr:uncharacterized protein LOC130463606 [Spinacia oleracea]